MIGRLSGTLVEKNPPQILLDVRGVAYEVDVPMSTFYNLPQVGEAVTLFVRESDQAKRFVARLEKKRGKGKALGILAAKLARAVYWMLRREEPFDVKRFWRS